MAKNKSIDIKAKRNDQPLVSIITPVYNGEVFIADTINRICEQTYKKWEWIIIDDASTDKTVKIVKKTREQLTENKKLVGDIQVIELKENGGQAKARNIGVDMAKGDYLCFLDADDAWDCDKIFRQVDFMKKNNCAFSYHSYEFANEKCEPIGKKVIAEKVLNYRQALKDNMISTITVMFDLSKIRRDLIRMPDLKYVEDTATWWRILRNGYTAYGIPDLFAYYRRMPNTSSSNKLRTQKPLWNLYRNVEKLNFFDSAYCLFWKNVHAVLRRI